MPPGAPRAGYPQSARNNQHPLRHQTSSSSSRTSARTQANTRQKLHQAASPQAQRLPNLGQAEVECYVCLDNFSPRDTIACQSTVKKHYICKPCAKEYVTAQIGDQKFAILCGGEKCNAALPKNPLVAILDAKTLQRWEILVTQRTLQLAKIPGLEQCPFCEFQCVLPSVSEAPVFVCRKCGKVSCRMCKKEEHPMRKCEEVAGKDSKGKEKSVVEKARQELEEALSEALIQRCR
jgi:TRIAD3 protein (E3 ubiquitin-protein ligase RNF216)